ncbi:MAG TPA: hypothetical protein VD907_06080 [Verrucomicrobiae bacterium]|nr:hypothetical protein [Verrucomicrobiae bacterium]
MQIKLCEFNPDTGRNKQHIKLEGSKIAVDAVMRLFVSFDLTPEEAAALRRYTTAAFSSKLKGFGAQASVSGDLDVVDVHVTMDCWKDQRSLQDIVKDKLNQIRSALEQACKPS